MNRKVITYLGIILVVTGLISAPRIDSRFEAGRSVAAQSIPRSINLSPADGERGTLLTVAGEGFQKATTATVYLDADGNGYMGRYEIALATAIIGNDGKFTASFTVEAAPFVPGAKNRINAKDGLTGSAEVSVPFTLLGKVTVMPDHGYNGDAIEITLQDFPPNMTLSPGTVTLGGARVTIRRQGNQKTYPRTDSQGNASFVSELPFSSPAGYQSLTVDMPCTCSTRSTEFNVLQPYLTVSPHEAVANQMVVLRGANFSPSSFAGGPGPHRVHQVTGVAHSSISLDGVLLLASYAGYPINVDSDGLFYAQIVLPITTKTMSAGGLLEIKVTDSRGRTGVTSLTIKQRTLSVEPATSPPDAMITVTGDGFVANSSGHPSYITVDVDYAGTIVSTVTPDVSGSFETAFAVPMRTSVSSSNLITATAKTFSYSATTSHSVPAKSMTISPDAGPPGTRVTVTGVSFPRFTALSDLTISGRRVLPSPVPATGNAGSFTTVFTVPQLANGFHAVAVTARGISDSVFFEVRDQGTPPAPRSGPTQSLLPRQVSTLPSNENLTAASQDVPVSVFAPLGDNLLRVWHYNEPRREWALYDPRPLFAAATTLTALVPDKIYFINVSKDQTVNFNGRERSLYAGWNVLHW